MEPRNSMLYNTTKQSKGDVRELILWRAELKEIYLTTRKITMFVVITSINILLDMHCVRGIAVIQRRKRNTTIV